MKTPKTFTALLSILAVTFALNLNADNLTFADEAYIDDIPFDTESISTEYRYRQAVSTDFSFAEEAYIDDIPFNTARVVANCLYQKALQVEFNFSEEDYIDDIPEELFSTVRKIQIMQLVVAEQHE